MTDGKITSIRHAARLLALAELQAQGRLEGIRPAEIARRFGVHRSTIGRHLSDLPAVAAERDRLLALFGR